MRRILDSWKSSSAPWAVFSAIFCISVIKLFYKDSFNDPVLFGFAAYFLVVACFVFFGSRVRPSSSITQVSAALSIGILVWIFADIFFKPKDKAPDVAQFVCDVGGKFSPKDNTTSSLRFFCRPSGSEKNDVDAPENPCIRSSFSCCADCVDVYCAEKRRRGTCRSRKGSAAAY